MAIILGHTVVKPNENKSALGGLREFMEQLNIRDSNINYYMISCWFRVYLTNVDTSISFCYVSNYKVTTVPLIFQRVMA